MCICAIFVSYHARDGHIQVGDAHIMLRYLFIWIWIFACVFVYVHVCMYSYSVVLSVWEETFFSLRCQWFSRTELITYPHRSTSRFAFVKWRTRHIFYFLFSFLPYKYNVCIVFAPTHHLSHRIIYLHISMSYTRHISAMCRCDLFIRQTNSTKMNIWNVNVMLISTKDRRRATNTTWSK